MNIINIFSQARKRSNRKLDSSLHQSSVMTSISQDEIQTTKTMLLVIVCSLTAWTPLMIRTIIYSTSQNVESEKTSPSINHRLIENLCLSVLHYSSAIDALIFAYRIKDVRLTIYKMFKCKVCCLSHQKNPDLNTANP